MANSKKKRAKTERCAEPEIKLVAKTESSEEFKIRCEEVRILLIEMFLGLKKKGRPSTKNDEDLYVV